MFIYFFIYWWVSRGHCLAGVLLHQSCDWIMEVLEQSDLLC